MIAKKLFGKIKSGKHKGQSMQFRFLITIIFAMLSITVFVGGLSIYQVDNYIQNQTESFVRATCENEGTQINNTFEDMEKSVKIMASYVMGFLPENVDVSDRDLQAQIFAKVDEMFVDVARYTEGAVAYYLRLDPAISDGKAGVFYSKLDGGEDYVSLEPTDLLLYDRDDVEHVGWFWQPYDAGEPIWMLPYHNQNNNILMISYVVPLYYGDTFIGVVGMDFDYPVLTERIHGIRIYENGFAHLERNGTVVHDADHGHEDEAHPERYLRVSKELVNGMTLVLSASYDDIRQIRYDISLSILFAVLILSAIFILLAIFIVKRIVDPLKKLTEASIKLSDGEYDVEIVHSNTQEIKLLSAAFENMRQRLREREKKLRISAYVDSLTGMRNATSYKTWTEEVNRAIQNQKADFGVVVLDVNYLKETNDRYGHDVGNELIISVAGIIEDVFAKSIAFRVGGDEFVVVLQNSDPKDCEKLFLELDQKCAHTFIDKEDAKIPVSIARGFARFEAGRDKRFADVFKRADDAMYENKRKIKSLLAVRV